MKKKRLIVKDEIDLSDLYLLIKSNLIYIALIFIITISSSTIYSFNKPDVSKFYYEFEIKNSLKEYIFFDYYLNKNLNEFPSLSKIILQNSKNLTNIKNYEFFFENSNNFNYYDFRNLKISISDEKYNFSIDHKESEEAKKILGNVISTFFVKLKENSYRDLEIIFNELVKINNYENIHLDLQGLKKLNDEIEEYLIKFENSKIDNWFNYSFDNISEKKLINHKDDLILGTIIGFLISFIFLFVVKKFRKKN